MDQNRFQPLAKRGLLWAEKSVLFVSDLHLGKEATFTRAGIAVPRGSSHRTLQRVTAMLAETGAKSLIILGDLFHARCSLAEDIKALFSNFLTEHSRVKVLLVKGNHDRAAGRLDPNWQMDVAESPFVLDNVELSHFPDQVDQGCEMRIAGHIHPAVRLRGSGHHNQKLACFHFSAQQRCLTLPAIGEFTGTQRITPGKSDRIWIMPDEQVLEIDRRLVE